MGYPGGRLSRTPEGGLASDFKDKDDKKWSDLEYDWEGKAGQFLGLGLKRLDGDINS